MDILNRISSEKLTEVFGWPQNIKEKISVLAQKVNIESTNNIKQTYLYDFEKMFFDISEYLYGSTAVLKYHTTRIDHIPKNTKGMHYQKDEIYIGASPDVSGSWAQIDIDVFWNGMKGVIKHINEERQVENFHYNLISGSVEKRVSNITDAEKALRIQKYGRCVFFTTTMYELIIQLYLSESVAIKGLVIPKLYWVRKNHKLGVDAFMQKAPGVFLHMVPKEYTLLALAHVLKHLWVLQLQTHFMHRDFHAGNISFDVKSKQVGIIDFGMSCINPTLGHVAWQANNPDFYPILNNSHASKCTNRSLDVCCLVASLENYSGNSFLTEEYENMLVVFKSKLAAASPALKHKFETGEDYYTKIDGKHWYIGNNIEHKSQQHFWTYSMSEFPEEKWFPENLLKRLLPKLPLKDWFQIRKNFTKPFDSIMPQINIVTKGKTGTLIKLHQKNKLKVRVGSEMLLVDLNDIVI